MSDEDEFDLSDLVPDDAFTHPDCFSSASYWRWEKEVAQPIIEEKGYRVIRWFSTDQDSFGPLVRAVEVEKDGEIKQFTYG